MQKTAKLRIRKGIIVFLFLSLFFQLLNSSCQNKSISNPYKAPAAKPKPCKCATSNKPWLSQNNLSDFKIHNNLLLKSGLFDYAVE
jgi:hypothetical protein